MNLFSSVHFIWTTVYLALGTAGIQWGRFAAAQLSVLHSFPSRESWEETNTEKTLGSRQHHSDSAENAPFKIHPNSRTCHVAACYLVGLSLRVTCPTGRGSLSAATCRQRKLHLVRSANLPSLRTCSAIKASASREISLGFNSPASSVQTDLVTVTFDILFPCEMAQHETKRLQTSNGTHHNRPPSLLVFSV